MTKKLKAKKVKARRSNKLATAALAMYRHDEAVYKKGSGKLLLTRARFNSIKKALAGK